MSSPPDSERLTHPAQRAIDAVWRAESGRIIGALARMVRDIGVAEEFAQDALVAALERWPQAGVPDKPGAWLMQTAKHRAIDWLRRQHVWAAREGEITFELETQLQDAAPVPPGSQDAATIDDDLLRLVFVACHPVLSFDARVALTLRLLGGLSTEEIARAFLAPEPTIAQRIVRAKRNLKEAGVPFQAPAVDRLGERLAAVLEVIYLIFNEGYAATAGCDWLRPALCDEALRLARMVAALMPQQGEAQGLLALLEIQNSRSAARTGPDGEPVLLMQQDRDLWDRPSIEHGLAALARADALARGTARAPGPYALQASIAACHARAACAAGTDWTRIAELYETLAAVAPSPVVELNRAVAVSMAFGAAVGLEIVDRLRADPALGSYHLLPGVRGDLLVRLGRCAEARAEFERAADLTKNRAERTLMLSRALSCS